MSESKITYCFPSRNQKRLVGQIYRLAKKTVFKVRIISYSLGNEVLRLLNILFNIGMTFKLVNSDYRIRS